ncbi:MAG: RNA polymerase subunit sigma-24 [Acidobacteria bacterium]|nr:MAG: RNA polymerase subunit sigma-24 [Acidobacteriota bacterium]
MSDTAFEELAMPLFDSLYRYARCLADDRAEAEDLVQETYLKGLRGFESFAPGTNFRAWMFRILRNTFLTSRSGLRAVPLDDAPAIQDEATPETQLIQRVNRESLRRAIERLPIVFREVLILCDVENSSYKEIAETLSIPIGTVTSRLIRARQKLRVALGES